MRDSLAFRGSVLWNLVNYNDKITNSNFKEIKAQLTVVYVVMLCYVMLCYVMLCYVMLCYVMLCFVLFCYRSQGLKGGVPGALEP